MQKNWKYNFGQISAKFLLWILSVGIRSDFSQKASFGRYRLAIFWIIISLISTICGVLTRTHLADSWRYTAARISRAFWHRASSPVFWKTVVFFYVLSWCPLSVKLQGFVSVCYCCISWLLLNRMLRAWEFPSAHESPCHMLSGSDRRLRAARSGDASGCFGQLEKEKRWGDIDSWSDNIHS